MPRPPSQLFVIVAVAAALAACGDERRAGPSSSGDSVFVLLADNRLLEVSLPGGEIMAAEKLGPSPRSTAPGRLLARDGRTLFVLVRGTEGSGDAVVAVDTGSVRVRGRHALARRLKFGALVIGPRTRRLYMLGNREGRLIPELRDLGDVREVSVAVTVLDPTSGRSLAASTVRNANGHDWWIYTAAISTDERRLLVSYHGASTTGVDWIDITGTRFGRCREEPLFPGAACAGNVHGGVEPYRDGVLAATGSHTIVELSRDGGVVRNLETRLRRTHLMELALDPDGARLYAVGSCYKGGGLGRVDLRTGRSRVLAQPEAVARIYGKLPEICGDRIAVARGSVLAIAKTSSASPSSRRSGALLLVDSLSGRLIRKVATPAEPVDVIVVPGSS